MPRLVEAGHRVRCLVRDSLRLQGRPWGTHVEVVQGDVLDPDFSPGGHARCQCGVLPKWVFTGVQPIAIRNVLDLVAAIESTESAGRIIEIGGQDVLTYAEMMTRYARVRDLKRVLIAVPVLTPRLSSYWVHLITPVPANIARPLIKGLMNEVIVHDDTARKLFPKITLLDYETSVRLAFEKIKQRGVETSWTDALASSSTV